MPKKNSKLLTDPGIGKISRAKKGNRVERFDAGVPGPVRSLEFFRAWALARRLRRVSWPHPPVQ